MCERKRMLMVRKAQSMIGQVSWGMIKKILLYELPEKMKDFLRLDTVGKVSKIWQDFASVYKEFSNWEPSTSPTEFWIKAKQWISDFISLNGLREGYERKRVTPYMHIMVAHIPWFLELYSTVKIFTGQGVERNNDVARSIVLRKSNKWDSIGDILRLESRQWHLKHRERKPRSYSKRKTAYWEEGIYKRRKENVAPEHETTQISSSSIDEIDISVQACSTSSLNSTELQTMTIPQIRQQLKSKGIKGISKKQKTNKS